MTSKLLVINAGSSSIKWTLFEKKSLAIIATGLAERIGIDGGRLEMKFKSFTMEEINLPSHQVAVMEIMRLWKDFQVITNISDISDIGFRVVQGGHFFHEPTILDETAIEKIGEAGKYAPLHNPGAILAIRAFMKLVPNAQLVACFDTAFHATLPDVNYTYPIDHKIAKQLGIRKYGMHGISHAYISQRLAKILNKKTVNFVNCHIGNGASLCAIKDGKSFDTSMGLTPLAGLMMGTRSGDIDPSIPEFVSVATGMSVVDVTTMLNKKSGLLGTSGISSDMRDVIDAANKGHSAANLAIEMYTDRIASFIVNYTNKLGLDNFDGIVFTAGIGENSAIVRAKTLAKLRLINVEIDQTQNEAKYDDFKLISAPGSQVPVYVIRTNEELMIAMATKDLSKHA